MITLIIGPSEAGSRLDRVLRKRLPLVSLSDIYALIRKGGVRIETKRLKQDYRLKENDALSIDVNPSELKAPDTRDSGAIRQLRETDFFKKNFRVIFEDDHLLACDKPQGLVVHPGTGHLQHDTLIDLATSYLLHKKAPEEPELVHRLDRDTSGVILLAKSKGALREVHEEFRSRSIIKEYRAVSHHRPAENEGTVRLGMSRNFEAQGGTKMKVDKEGSMSQTRYRIMEYHDDLSRLEIFLDTGKTHQIRVHLAHLGAPIVGDVRYGDPALDEALFTRSRLPRRLYLHARRLVFNHPFTKRKLSLEAPEPPEFFAMMNAVAGPR